MQSLLQGRTQLRPFLPAPSKQKRGAVRAASTCRCSMESSTADRRTLLVALLSLGFAAQAEAKTAAAPAKRDAYEELQEIVKGRGGSTSLLKSFKPEAVQKTVQKGIVAPLTSSPQKAALAKPAVAAGSGGPSAEVLGGLGLLGLIGAVTASNSGKSKAPAAGKKPALGTQRISAAPAPAKQAARKVASAGTKVLRTPAPVKQVKKAASKAQAAAKPSGGLFGTRKVGPASGTTKLANKAAAPAQKAKQTAQKATRQATKQATRKVQQGAGSVKELLNEDTSSTIGAAGIFGLAVVVAGALVLGSPKPAPKPAVAAPKELAPRPVKRAQETVQAVLKEAPKVADKVKPPSLPTTPPPPPVTAEKPKVPSGPDLIPDAVKKPQTPSTPPPTFPKPSTPSGPTLRPPPPASTQAKAPSVVNPAAAVAAAPAAPSPATYGILALAVAGLAGAAVATSKKDGEEAAPAAPAAAPTTAASSAPDENTPEALAQRKAEVRKWIDDWRAKQK